MLEVVLYIQFYILLLFCLKIISLGRSLNILHKLFNGYMVFPRMDIPYVNYPKWMLGSFLTYINTAINITIHTSPSALLNISLGYHPRRITSGSRDFGF